MALKKPAPAVAKPAAKAPAAKSAAPAAKAKSPAAPPAPPQATISLKQVAAELAEAHELERRDAEALLGEMVEVLVAHLRKGDRLRLGGLGILQVKDSPARAGRNPATGEQIQIAAKRKIMFRPAKDLKDALTG
jgi:DNA-binding protein HU-beta